MHIIVASSRKKNLTVENALMSASTYEIVKDRGIHVRSEKTKRVKEIFELFGVEDPKQLHLLHQAP